MKYPINRRSRIVALILLVCSVSAFAQHLPETQQGPVLAPATIKIDGKADEWNDQFQAYNSSNFLFYTISNDQQNLYLAIKMRDVGNRKIFRGGITFSIYTVGKNKLAFTYPAVPQHSASKIDNEPDKFDLVDKNVQNSKNLKKQQSKGFMSGLITGMNVHISNTYRQIQVSGLKNVKELIPVDNDAGIKVAAAFDNEMQFVYELAIPLKYLTDISQGERFSYNIRLNAEPTVLVKGFKSSKAPLKSSKSSSPESYLNISTDFSGQYSLAK